MNIDSSSYLIIAYILSAGICLTITAQTAIIGLRAENTAIYRYFSALAFAVTIYLSATVAYYQAESIEFAALALKTHVMAICIAYPLSVKFIQKYTRKENNKVFAIVSIISLLLIIVNYFSAYSLRYESLDKFSLLVMPWGEELNRHYGRNNPYKIFGMTGLAIYAWGIFQGFQLHQRGERFKGAILSFSLILILLGGIWGVFIDSGLINSFYIAGFAFLSLVVVMSLQLANEYHDFTKQIEKNNYELELAASSFEAHDAILILGPDLTVARINKSFIKLTDYQAEELIGKFAFIFDTEKYNADFYHDLLETLFSKKEWTGHTEIRHKNGAAIPVFAKFTLLKDASERIKNIVCIYNDLSEIKSQEEYLKHIQNVDQLTGLPSRKYFIEQLTEYLNSTSESNEYGALIFIDLDDFKSVNDTYGHAYGDLILFKTAFRLKHLMKSSDLITRFGVDEFVIFLKNIGTNEIEVSYAAADFAEQALKTISEKYSLPTSEQCFIKASIGVTLSLGHIKNPFELIKRADIAMTSAEKLGGNCIQFFERSLQDNVERHTHLLFDLHKAIEKNQLQLYYQLQVNQDLVPVGAEALIRWNHPEKGLISPAEFIPLAEKSTLIKHIGYWILHAACKQLELWSHQTATKNLKLSVNISAIQLMDIDFVDQVKSIIAAYEIDPTKLKFEITETIAIDNINSAIDKMLTLKQEFGIHLSIDDFGTGYSSLSQLKNLPIDEIKIDLSFIKSIATNKTDEMVVKTIIDLGKNLNFDIVAEGVEHKEQYHLLKSHGCHQYQGYLFAKPLPIDDFDLHLLNFKHTLDYLLFNH